MKCHHPDVFCAALLNAWPMGFYAPAQVVRDAREHGVEVRQPCINASRWECTLEPAGGRYLAVRLGLCMINGMANLHGAAIVGARGDASYDSVDDVWRRSGVPRAAIERLADADAFHALRHDRRQALWQGGASAKSPSRSSPPPMLALAAARAKRRW
jgi:error-prone DNA polymerase